MRVDSLTIEAVVVDDFSETLDDLARGLKDVAGSQRLVDERMDIDIDVDVRDHPNRRVVVNYRGPRDRWRCEVPILPSDFYDATEPLHLVWFDTKMGVVIAVYDDMDAVYHPRPGTWSFQNPGRDDLHSDDATQLLWSFDRERESMFETFIGDI